MRFGRRGAALLGGLGLIQAGFMRSAQAATETPAQAGAKGGHRMAMHIDSGLQGDMEIALHNLTNAADYYKAQGQTIAIELVANGPGYAMLRDTSPVRAMIAEVQRAYPTVVFSACQNSRRGMARAEGKTVEQVVELPGMNDVPAGVVRLVELQEQGWPYYKV